jgi:parallel beta-helix repeat protein
MTIENNPVTNSGRYGIYLAGSGNSAIINNSISTNLYGVYLHSSTNSLIYHNNFINNSNYNAYDNRATNSWDNGYSSGGNYWSDYTGTDIYTGPTQKQPGSDGIGDTPYNISGGAGAKDRYPLMIPFSAGMKGDLNGNGISADAGDLVLMKRASIGEITADSRYDLNGNGQFADAGDLVFMKRASIGEINL